ncbi:hypothetical protein GCM10011375_05810 [Hymenobacter qilianensis]|uniref:Uncharacterized protein n=1 Tax=Hymenobacter qilianensis TaxID=1385715 RepID=A0ACB5PMH0_9BACT|nr:hypothetical protein GCM10011375_05810 [Hymenobacter qilianensis]
MLYPARLLLLVKEVRAAKADSKVVDIRVTAQILPVSRAQLVAKDRVPLVLVVLVRVQVSQGRIKMPPGLLPLLITQSRTISRFRSRSRLRWLSSAVAVVATRTTGQSIAVISAPV